MCDASRKRPDLKTLKKRTRTRVASSRRQRSATIDAFPSHGAAPPPRRRDVGRLRGNRASERPREESDVRGLRDEKPAVGEREPRRVPVHELQRRASRPRRARLVRAIDDDGHVVLRAVEAHGGGRERAAGEVLRQVRRREGHARGRQVQQRRREGVSRQAPMRGGGARVEAPAIAERQIVVGVGGVGVVVVQGTESVVVVVVAALEGRVRPRDRRRIAARASARDVRGGRELAPAFAQASEGRGRRRVPPRSVPGDVGRASEKVGQAGGPRVPPEEDERGRARAGGGGDVGDGAAADANARGEREDRGRRRRGRGRGRDEGARRRGHREHRSVRAERRRRRRRGGGFERRRAGRRRGERLGRRRRRRGRTRRRRRKIGKGEVETAEEEEGLGRERLRVRRRRGRDRRVREQTKRRPADDGGARRG